ncbi:MAG: tRNA pseudouridine(13) synthase TruD [Candidatus Brocadia sp.]|nr:tRNA pseudouridine(13) synthase TruD [Candidatus Brocadia sp.]
MLKIKVKPEDFIVEEVAGLPLQKDGNFRVYLLKKRGWNTVDILKMLSRKFSIPYSYFSYGGKKDKYAFTSQYITIARQGDKKTTPPLSSPSQGEDREGRKKFRIKPPNSRFHAKDKEVRSNSISLHEYPVPTKVDEENYSLSFVGYMDRPMGPDLITGNKFQIVVRNLTENDLTSALHEIDRVKQDGYPNYFDDQRFGSFDARQGFIAEKILKKHYNGALKIYFSSIHPEDSKEEKEHRKFFYENWGNWQECLKGATSKFEKETFRYLEKHPKGFIPILQRISHEKMVLFFSAYQSHIWNEVLRKIIRSVSNDSFMSGNSKTINSSPSTGEIRRGCREKNDHPPLSPRSTERSRRSPIKGGEIISRRPDLKISKGIAGDYVFYMQLGDRSKAYLGTLVIPMPASNIRMPDDFTKNLYSEVLKENNLKSPMFNIRKLRQAFFKGIERKAIVTPEDLSVDSAEDEIYQGKKKLILKFFLPRGCYGTMFIKRLFC